MKNLKKVLALVLVFASLFGVATMASATKSDDYSDAESISHVEAVDVMSTIGVFDGISGAFSGDSILTREQAAKIITYMILGKDQADALVASVAPYTDVARDRWSAGSIAYCKNAGILAGVGNGRFEPNGKLTGVAFAKMCLVALGYDPDIEGLTGSSWAVNTSTLAIASAGITANLSQISLADEMNREDACQMAFNTIKADLVDYANRGMNVTVNNSDGSNVVVSGTPSKATPVDWATARVDEKNSMGNIKDERTTANDDYGYTNATNPILQFGERYFPKLKVVLDHDSFGRPANIWTYKSEEIGTYRRNDWLVQSWTAKASKGEMYNAISGTAYKKLGNENSTLNNCYVNGSDTLMAGTKVSDWFVKNSSATAGKPNPSEADPDRRLNTETGNGVLTELYMNNDGKVWISMINTYLVKANADYNSTKESVSIEAIAFDDETEDNKEGYTPVGTSFLPNEISNDDFDVTGVKEGDYLLLTVSGIKDNFTKSTLEEVAYATIQKGTVTEYTDNSNVIMGGTKYSYNKILRDSQTGTQFAIDSEATLVLDTYGYIMHVDDSVDSSRYVYIDKFAHADRLDTAAIADAYFTDGTNEHISVSKVTYYDGGSETTVKSGTTIGSWDNSPGNDKRGWYTFTGSTGGKYTLKAVKPEESMDASVTYTAQQKTELIKSGTVKFASAVESNALRGDDKTIFVIKTDDGATAYTGISSVPNVKFKGAYSAKVFAVQKGANAAAKYVFVDASNALLEVEDSNSAVDYMYVLKEGKKTTHVNGSEYKTYTVVIDGKIEERWVATDADVKDNRFYSNVTENSNGYIKSAKEVGVEGTNARKFMAYMGPQNDPDKYKAAGHQEPLNSDNYGLNWDCTITRSGSTLTVSALANAYSIKGDTSINKADLVTNSKSEINLVIGKNCKKLLKDTGADYEVYPNTSINQLTGLLGKNKLGGRVYLVTTEDDGSVIDKLWVYVDEVYP